MTLATFPMIILRWKRSNLFREEYAEYVQLTEYVCFFLKKKLLLFGWFFNNINKKKKVTSRYFH